MTQEEIIALAREAGLLAGADMTSERNNLFAAGLVQFATLVAEAEREAWIAALQPAITQRMGAEQVREAIQKVINYRSNQ